MEEQYKEAFVEVLDIIDHTDLELVRKISKKFLEFLNVNKSENYISKIDFNDINWQNKIKPETQEVMALIYRDCFVSNEKRKELIQKEKQELLERYSYENIFKNTKNENFINVNSTPTESLIVIEEKWYSKIVTFFKKLFSKK